MSLLSLSLSLYPSLLTRLEALATDMFIVSCKGFLLLAWSKERDRGKERESKFVANLLSSPFSLSLSFDQARSLAADNAQTHMSVAKASSLVEREG